MADNVAITTGSGTTVAADEVIDGTLGTVKVQYVKLMDGALDGTTKAGVGANGLKVDGSGVTQPVSGSLTTVSTVTSLSQMAGAAISMGTGVRGVGVQRVTIATDDVVPASQSGTWIVQPGNTANATPWLAKISDGTNAAAIKAALTAPAATDPAVVVAISPNSVNANGSAASANSAPVVVASDQAPVAVKGNTVVQAASSTITRPANTSSYSIGALVANSTTAASVANLQFTTLARVSGGSGVIIGAQIQKSSNVVTNAAFRLHLFNTAPTYVTSGDGGQIVTVVQASAKGYLGYVDITAMVGFSDVAWGSGAPDNTRGSIPFVATAQTIFGLLEARLAYTPVSGEVFTITLDALQD